MTVQGRRKDNIKVGAYTIGVIACSYQGEGGLGACFPENLGILDSLRVLLEAIFGLI